MDEDEIEQIIERHVEAASDAEVRSRLEAAADSTTDVGETAEHQLMLLPTVRRALPLTAYLASALTGLAESERQLIFALSDIIAAECADQGIDLYEPRKATDPVHHAEVPDSEVWALDHERVVSSDLVIHLCHHPSTGAGEELAYAHDALVPIMLISHSTTRVSRMITGIPAIKIHIEYDEPERLRVELRQRLAELRPLLEQRRLAFSDHESNVVGEKVRQLRESLNLTRAEVARAVGIEEGELRRLEESSDHTANWSLAKLRAIATILRTTVSDLVEPDLGEQILTAVDDWAHGREAARFPGLSSVDQRRLVRELLRRVSEEIDPDKED